MNFLIKQHWSKVYEYSGPESLGSELLFNIDLDLDLVQIKLTYFCDWPHYRVEVFDRHRLAIIDLNFKLGHPTISRPRYRSRSGYSLLYLKLEDSLN